MEDLLLDIRYALRVLWKSPAFTIVALVTLMLGIGANVVVFGVVNAVLLHPLEVSDPQNLYQLRLKPWTSGKLLTTSYPAFEDYRRRNTTFSDLAGFYGFCQARLSWGNSAKSVYGYAVTGNYFEMLGVQPELGRFIQTTDEHGPNSAPYVVLSDSLWRSAFNADPGVIGTTVRLNKDSFTVMGVAPARFHGTEQFDWPDYFIPIVNYFDAKYLEDRTGRPLTVLGRLKPGVTPQQATENLNAIAAQLAKEYPQTDTGVPLRLVRPGLGGDAGDVIRRFLYSVTGLALLVLAGGVRESRQPVCGARGGSQSRAGASCGLGSEPVAVGAATVNRGDGVVGARRSRGPGDRGFAAACPEPVAIALWPSGSQRGCACVPGSSHPDLGKRAAVRVDSGAAGVAKQSVTGDEERIIGFNAAAPVCSAGPVARRTNCDLHVARDGLACRRPRHGSHVARSAGLPAAREQCSPT